MNCDIVKDLLPLYIDDVCTDVTEKCVREHLMQCEVCSKVYKEMTSEDGLSQYDVQDIVDLHNMEEAQPFKKIKKKQKMRMGVILIFLFILLGICIWGGIVKIQEEKSKISFKVETEDFYRVLQQLDEEIERKWGIGEELILELSGNTGHVFSSANGMYFRLLADGKQVDVSCTYNTESKEMEVFVNYRKNTGTNGYGISWRELIMLLEEVNQEEAELQNYVLFMRLDMQKENQVLLSFYEYSPVTQPIVNQEKLERSIPVTSIGFFE